MNEAHNILQFYVDSGVDIALENEPIDRFAQSEAEKTAIKDKPPALTKTLSENSPLSERLKNKESGQRAPTVPVATPATLPDDAAVQTARELAGGAQTLEELKQALMSFEGCNLKRTAKHTVFADGNPEADVMFIGEAPGRDEDIQGLPFVGKSGQLLDKMLAAISLDRTSVYICNAIAWRPPGNRTPTPAETEICRPFIERHIELANPKLIVLLGGSSAKTLLKTSEGILRLRGKWQTLDINGKNFNTLPTLHPAYLLRQPNQKKLAWQDLLKIKGKLGSNSENS